MHGNDLGSCIPLGTGPQFVCGEKGKKAKMAAMNESLTPFYLLINLPSL